MTIVHDLQGYDQSMWLDYIHRRAIKEGRIAFRIENGIRGLTSNPSIFQKAIADSEDYDSDIAELSRKGLSVKDIYENLAIADLQQAADLLRPIYDQTGGTDGYVSLEVNPELAYKTDETIAEALRLFEHMQRPNALIKIPATEQGLPAITRAISEGVNVNVTLMFSLRQYDQVWDAYVTGLEQRRDTGKPIDGVFSVASFFVSRVDTAVDKQLQDTDKTHLMGHIAIDNARLAYALFQDKLSQTRWQLLAQAGANVQKVLWGSTGTKNPNYPDTLYVDNLIGPDTINTVPPDTLDAFLENGSVGRTVDSDLDGARQRRKELAEAGVDLDQITDQLLEDGVKKFADSFEGLLASIREKMQ
ncbi:MAG: transaldolase [Phycisphaerae bacterium]